MSVDLMSSVFKANIPEITLAEEARKVSTPTLKLVLLALADHANDEGEGAYPSQTRIERKTGLSHTSVNAALRALLQEGYISRIGESKRGTTEYTVDPQVLVRQRYYQDGGSAPQVLGQSASGTTPSAPGVREPSSNHPEPQGEESKNLEHPAYKALAEAASFVWPTRTEQWQYKLRPLLIAGDLSMDENEIVVAGLGRDAAMAQDRYAATFESVLFGVLGRPIKLTFRE